MVNQGTPAVNPNDDFHKTDLSTYRAIERWAFTLFLGAIGGVTHQLVGWVAQRTGAFHGGPLRDAPIHVSLAPLAVGLLANVFLRICNLRATAATVQLRKYEARGWWKRGWLGRFIAWVPVLAGLGGMQLVQWSRLTPAAEARMAEPPLITQPLVVAGVAIAWVTLVEVLHAWSKKGIIRDRTKS
jgi:hypothetical protein